MKSNSVYSIARSVLRDKKIHGKAHLAFTDKLIGKIELLHFLFKQLYSTKPDWELSFQELIGMITDAYSERNPELKKRDLEKAGENGWVLSNELVGMSLYVDRFAGKIKGVEKKLDYFEELGVNFLHLMPLFESPKDKSDGGYAVSNYRKVDERLGSLKDLKKLQKVLQERNMYLMLDLVLNHTSDEHEWAHKAREGDAFYQDFYYTYDDRAIPDMMEAHMPEVFPESSPGNFTYDKKMNKWVMTVFHNYQWDLNFTNPQVLKAMLNTIFFYANLGVDVLRIDAPAFIWKKMGTSCQNLPEAHIILQIIKAALEIAAPGMAILGEAIVAPREIMTYFGKAFMAGKECDIAYNAAQMALQWDALATTDTRNMVCNQDIILQKPLGTTWINYTRCHDDIGLAFEDRCIEKGGFNPSMHRDFLKKYYSGQVPFSPSRGELFGVNPRSNDARISGSLAALCGLETAIESDDHEAIHLSINKILLMQANSVLLGGIPMLFYGDEVGYTNDYSYRDDPDKNYDNRWMHRPMINWKKNRLRNKKGSVENFIFKGLQKLLSIRKKNTLFSDRNNIEWLVSHNRSVVGFKRFDKNNTVVCLFNYSPQSQVLSHYVIDTLGGRSELFDLWGERLVKFDLEHEFLSFEPYQFYILTDRH